MENAKTSTKFLAFALLFTTMLLTHSILSLVSISNSQSRLTEVVDAPAASYSEHTTLMHLAGGILTITVRLGVGRPPFLIPRKLWFGADGRRGEHPLFYHRP
jgi:hypothetical protein